MPATSLPSGPINRRTFTIGSAVTLAAIGGTRFAPTVAAAAADLPALTVIAKDYSLELPATAGSGLTTVTLDNQGQEGHHAIFLKLNDGVTVDQVAAAKNEVEVFTFGESLGGPMVGPGGKESVTFDLKEGKYAVLCIIPGPDGMPHYQMGMISPFEVTAGTSTGAAPTASMTIELMEMMFHGLPETVQAGSTTWEVTNAGTAVHELVLFKLADGATGDQVLSILLGPPPSASPAASPVMAATPAVAAGPPPFSVLGAAAPMSPGHTVYAELTLEAGNYFAACFIFDPSAGKPHALMGMQMSFTVN